MLTVNPKNSVFKLTVNSWEGRHSIASVPNTMNDILAAHALEVLEPDADKGFRRRDSSIRPPSYLFIFAR